MKVSNITFANEPEPVHGLAQTEILNFLSRLSDAVARLPAADAEAFREQFARELERAQAVLERVEALLPAE